MHRKMEPLIVCTGQGYGGVFFGYMPEAPAYIDPKETYRLYDARMVFYWNKETKGVFGLAAKGPQPGCQISDPVKFIDLVGVSCFIYLQDDAKAVWEQELWKKGEQESD